MGIKELESHLRKVGDERIAQIRKERDSKLAALKDEVERSASEAVKDIEASGSKEAKAVKRRILARAKIEAKSRVEKEKIALIDRVFEEAKDRVLKAPDAKKREILKALADEASEEIEDPVLYVDSKYTKLLPSAKSRSMDFGVIAESKTGSVVVDNTLAAKLARMRDSITPKVVEVLFNGK